MDTHDNCFDGLNQLVSDLMYEDETLSYAEALEYARVTIEKTFLDISNEQDTEDDE